MKTIKTSQQFKEFVGSTGKLFSVTFVKKDGKTRNMVARLGVTSYLTGSRSRYDAATRNNVIVFSMRDHAYRTICIDRLLKVKAFGELIENN
tara:strand:+ start:39 stop:314 length:276 start_codon:yes stop_codon:yes gene_type:complete